MKNIIFFKIVALLNQSINSCLRMIIEQFFWFWHIEIFSSRLLCHFPYFFTLLIIGFNTLFQSFTKYFNKRSVTRKINA